MKTQTDRAGSRENENCAIKLVIAFIGEARAYRFLYGQPAHENTLVQEAHNESVLRHHTAARTALQGLIERGLTPSLQDRCEALLMPYGEPETSYAMNAEALRAWADDASKPKPAAAPVEPTIKPLTPREQYTVRAILSCGPMGALTGEKIIDSVYKAFNHNMDSGTLTAIFKALADNGIVIEHRRGAGYFISDPRIRDILAKTYPPIQPAKAKA